jgi:outer membrane protein OmpA-like peptidoglycan-associated protein
MKNKILLLVLFMGILSTGIAQNLNPVLAKMGDDEWQSAYDDLEVIMKKKKKNLDAKFYAGICLTNLYRPEEAIELFKLSADLGQDIPMYYVFFAEAYIRAEQIQNAKNIFARAGRDNIDEADMPQFNRVQANIRADEKYLPNPKDIIVQNLGPNVNTDEAEYSPVMTQDHRGVFFTARRTAESEKSFDGRAFEQVLTTNMDNFDDWEKDAVLEGYGVGTDHDATVQLMNNDSTIVSFKNEDLFMSDLQADGTWANRRGIGNINTSKWDSHVYFYNGGNSMIYATAANTSGHLDLYIAHKDASGNWGRGTAIDELNTSENDDAPYVAEDGTLYFASRGHESLGGYDIFQTTYDSATNKFSAPENLGAPINTVNDDTFFSVYGKMAYLASARSNGYGNMDIYKIYLFKKTVVAGRLLNCDDQSPIVGATVSVEGQEDEFSATTDENGFYKMELPIETDFMLNIVKAGASLYKQKHFVKILFRDETDVGKDFLIGCPNPEGADERIIIKLENAFDLDPSAISVEEPEVVEVIPEPEVVEEEVVEEVAEVKAEAPVEEAAPVIVALPAPDIELPTVYFDFDKQNIKEEFFQRLNEAAELLTDRTDLRVFVGGHTDNYGTDEYNVALGQRRYDAVRDYLITKGVDPGQLETGTYGETIPAQNNRTRRGRALNRRVMLSFID